MRKDLQAEEAIEGILNFHVKPSARIPVLLRKLGKHEEADAFEAQCQMAEALAEAERKKH